MTGERRQRRPQYQHIDADCRRGMMELFREDTTTHTTETGSSPGFEANGVHGAVELCGLTQKVVDGLR